MTGVVEHRCADWQAMADELATLLVDDPSSVFATERVIVESVGTGRLLSQALASRIGSEGGVCAGVSFETVDQVRARLLAELGGPDRAADPWRRRALTFAIMESLVSLVQRPEFGLLAHHVGPQNDPDRPGRWLAASSRFAALLSDYTRDEPDMIRAWNRGEAVAPDGSALGEVDRWQFALWRELTTRTSVPDPVARHDELVAGLSSSSSSSSISVSDRVHVVAPWSLAGSDLELVEALGVRGRVHRWLVDEPSAPAPVHVHASHGPARQVEVLRDVLCGLFEDDPSLEPRDVIIVCPDLEAVAHLVDAAFEPGIDGHPGAALRVQVASAVRRPRNEVLNVLGLLLTLPAKRGTIADLLDIAGSPPVAHRFGFTPERLEEIESLLVATNVRGGVDLTHRQAFGVPVPQNTWLTGIDQLLAGLTMPEGDHWLGMVAPSDAIGSPQAPMVGALAELVSRLRRFMHLTRDPMTVAAWVGVLREQLDLFVSTSTDDSWMVQHAWRQLAELGEQAGDSHVLIGRSEFASVVDSLLRSSTGRPNYASGGLMVTRLGDLDGVPHKVICVLGADEVPSDGRPGDVLGDDSSRLETRRAQWRRALTVATERTVVVYGARSETTNEPLPMPVLLSSLLAGIGEAGGEVIHHQHPLQAFDPANFRRPATSFDRAGLAGARALTVVRQQPPTAADLVVAVSALPAPQLEVLTLTDMESWFASPTGFLLRQRAGIRLSQNEARPTALPLQLTALESWGLRDRLLRGLVAGAKPATAEGMEWRRGTVGPQALGAASMADAARLASDVHEAAGPLFSSEGEIREVVIEIAGVQISADLVLRQGVHAIVTASKAESKVWAGAWVSALIGSAAGVNFRGVELVGAPRQVSDWELRNGEVQRDVGRLRIPALPPDRARELLATVVAYVRDSLAAPLPLPFTTALKMAALQRRHREPLAHESLVAELERVYPRWSGDRASELFFPGYADLLALPGRSGGTRFMEGVRDVYLPMLAGTEAAL